MGSSEEGKSSKSGKSSPPATVRSFFLYHILSEPLLFSSLFSATLSSLVNFWITEICLEIF